jgi:predicted homoserine dehydrogenase-like protein
MNLHRLLGERAKNADPVRIGLIGCGKFGTMFLTQALQTPGTHVVGIADLDVDRARANLVAAGWNAARYGATSLIDAFQSETTYVSDDAPSLIGFEQLDVVIEATGSPSAGIRHCRLAIDAGHHVIMVSVEADVVAGPLLAREAAVAGVVYSLAWGDQPALVCEHVDWARACGLEVVCAGKGTRYHPDYHQLTPDTVWDVLREYLDVEDPASINLKMFNSFLDGSKSAIEMTAVCNATGLTPQAGGLRFPPASRFDLAETCKPSTDGGQLDCCGTTEVVSSLNRDGSAVPHHLAMGTYVVVTSRTGYARRCMGEYHMLADASGRYGALYRPTHMIGLELGISVASVVLRGEPTGAPVGFHADVVAIAKRPLKAGVTLDGEGGACVWGRQLSAARSLELGALPLGLTGDVRLKRDVDKGDLLIWQDVSLDETNEVVKARRQMESMFAKGVQ